MINKENLICPYCREENGEIRGKTFHTDDFKQTAGYLEPIYKDYLEVFILKNKKDKYAGLMIDNLRGARYIDIRFCPFCGRKLYESDVKRSND